MSKFRLFTGNKLENLLKQLITVLSLPLSSPFKNEIIIVQSKGMDRWISMNLASHFGIQANTQFPFPNSTINNIFKILLDYSPNNSVFSPEILTWQIMNVLPGLLDQKEFLTIKNYLSSNLKSEPVPDYFTLNTKANTKVYNLNDYKYLKLFQLSKNIADTFDQYLFYRPELIFAWENDNFSGTPENQTWQAILWNKIISDLSSKSNTSRHRAELRKILLEKLNNKSLEISELPERISIFGISVLLPYHLEIFSALSKRIDINLFILNPCREFWSYINSEREIASKTFVQGSLFFDNSLHLERGNKLLSSLGKIGREFYSIIQDLGFDNEPGYIKIDNFSEPSNNTMLSVIQSDILNLIDRKNEDKYKLNEIDNSIQIHNCHSPMREIEVLYDQIINILETNKDITQEDILVMIPDIDTYAPYIQSVFSNSKYNIAFNISDRKVLLESVIINTFLYILNLNDSRFRVQSILKLFEIDAIMNKFNFQADDIILIKKWITKTNIKWGFNDDSKKDFDLPSFKENTWQEGINRLLLGYCMSGENTFNDILPFPEIAITKSEVLNNFISFINTLADIVKILTSSETLANWSHKLLSILSDIFITDNNTEKELHILTEAILSLKEIEKITGFNKAIGINTVSYFLKTKFNSKTLSFSFLSGGITFCAMLPMRSIPFDVICLLGMNDNSFPVKLRKLEFDLISQFPKQGDRSRKKDDRYLFLETILSARKILYLSYTGQSISDNTELQPSILISEFIDSINETFEFKDSIQITEHITRKHKLQAFNKKYFSENKKYFSYSSENYKASIRSVKKQKSNFIFLRNNLPEPEYNTIDIDSLCYFYKNPCKYLLNKRFNLFLKKPEKKFDDQEPFNLNALDKYTLIENILEKALKKCDLTEYYNIVKAKGILPHGNIGSIIYFDILDEIYNFQNQVIEYIDEQTLIPIDLKLDSYHIKGNISFNKEKNIQVQYRYVKLKPFNQIKLWIEHLILCTHFNDNLEKVKLKSILLCKDNKFELNFVENSREILLNIIKKYYLGLLNTLFFFPETSMKFAQTLFKLNNNDILVLKQTADIKNAVIKAANVWHGNDFNDFSGEKKNLYYKYCFREAEPLKASFIKNSIEILYPLLNHC